jgi:hypothetical protein
MVTKGMTWINSLAIISVSLFVQVSPEKIVRCMALKTKRLRVEKGIIEKRKINEMDEERVKQLSLWNALKAAVQILKGKDRVFKIGVPDLMVFIYDCSNDVPFKLNRLKYNII